MHPYFWTSGFSIEGINRIDYDDGESIVLNAEYLISNMGFPDIVYTWNFYDSSDYSLISSTSGESPTVSFSRAQGENGIDVELIVDMRFTHTKFYKRRRLVIYPDTSVADVIIDLSSDPGVISTGEYRLQNGVDVTINPGDIVHLTGTVTGNRLRLIDWAGTTENPIILTMSDNDEDTATFNLSNSNGLLFADGCEHIHFRGKKRSDTGVNRMRLTGGGGLNYIHFTSGNVRSHDNIRISGLEVDSANSTGIKPKLDFVTRAVGACDDCWVYDNYIHGCINEGIYCGFFDFRHVTNNPSGFTGYHHIMDRLKVWANVCNDNGWDGLQVSSCPNETEVLYNFCKDNATSDTASQNFSIVLNTGFSGWCANNVCIRESMQALSYGDTYLYNNIFYAPTDDKAIFLRRGDNSGTETHYDPNAICFIFNNALIADGDMVYYLEINDGGTGVIPFAHLYYVNNVGKYGPSAINGTLRHVGSGAKTVNNLVPVTLSTLGFIDTDSDDFGLLDSAESYIENITGIDSSGTAGLTPVDLSNIEYDTGVYLTQKLITPYFVDITDQYIPINGNWLYSHIYRSQNHENTLPSPNRVCISWYQTAQTSIFSDADRLPETYGAIVKQHRQILNSSKPNYLAALKGIDTTDAELNLTFDDESFGEI